MEFYATNEVLPNLVNLYSHLNSAVNDEEAVFDFMLSK